MLTRWRKDYRRIRGITPEELARLQQARLSRQQLVGETLDNRTLSDTDELLERFVSAKDSGLGTLSGATNIDQGRMAELLRDSVLQSSRSLAELLRDSVSQSTAPQPKPFHWADIVVGVATLSVLVGLTVPLIDNQLKSKKKQPSPSPQAVALVDIPPFSTIRREDISFKNISSEEQGKEFAGNFVGRYSVLVIGKGKTISADSVSQQSANLSNLQIIQLDVKSMPKLDGRKLPAAVDILLSLRQNPGGGARISGLLLAVNSSGTVTTATIALASDAMSEGAKWFGSCDVYLSLSASSSASSFGPGGIVAGQRVER